MATFENVHETVLAFDFGFKTIGVAFGLSLTGSAQPLEPVNVKAGEPQWGEIDRHVQMWQPALLLVGLPFNMDGSESEMSLAARHFLAKLKDRYQIDTLGMDERLSTYAARDLLRQQDYNVEGKIASRSRQSNSKRRKRIKQTSVDSQAARLILESFFRQQGLYHQ